MKTELAEKIIDLHLYTRTVAGTRKGSFGLKESILFCLRNESLPPRELIATLGIAKTNLALLANKCIHEGLIVKSSRKSDGRAIQYTITDAGRALLNTSLERIEQRFSTVITSEKEEQNALNCLDGAIELMSFV